MRDILTAFHFVLISLVFTTEIVTAEINNVNRLEEIIITAQKREQSIQDVPISMTALSANDLSVMSIYGLGDLNGIIPSLNIQSLGNASTTLTIAIRGHAPDPSQITREGSVGVYIDGVYMSRAQGMGVDLADPERIEILRGPQGTLFGRNTVGGAVNIISKKPTGKFGVTQIIDVGNYDAVRSVTHLNLPALGGLSTKLDFIHDEFGGWIDNASGEADFTEYNNDGGRLSLRYNVTKNLLLDYAYDNTRTETAQYYFQLHRDFTPAQNIGPEPTRQHKPRYPIVLEPTIIKKNGHALTATWMISPRLTVKSISGYHELVQDTLNNYGGVLALPGLVDGYVIDQRQFSQELQFIGTSNQIEWVAGFYYFKEDAEQDFNTQLSLNPTTFERVTPFSIDSFSGETSVRSKAIFAQLTWTPQQLKNLQLTIGGRHTDDDKAGMRTRNPNENFNFGSESTDPMIAVTYHLTDNISAYARWSTAYKSVGYNLRSISFEPYDKEDVEASELGFKSMFLENRARLNLAVFSTVFENMQLDFINPDIITNPETKNAIDDVKISGAELDIAVTPIKPLTISASYAYLETDRQIQMNPLDTTLSQAFHVTQAPKHAGSVAVDYRISRFFSTNINVVSTDHYAHVAFEPLRLDAYTIVNARLALDIPYKNSNVTAALWGKNLLDEEYITNGFSVRDPVETITQVFGDPRTYGISLIYTF